MRAFLIVLLAVVGAALLPAAKNLEIYFIDVEGGQATLFVSPAGDSMLVDTGWSGNNSRDANRIAAAAKHAGVKAIDYLLITHFHEDHVGGVPQLAGKLPIRNFIDHGESVEQNQRAKELYAAYVEYRAKGNHILAKPGVTIPVKGLDVKVLTADGDEIDSPLPGAGQPNPLCAADKLRSPDPTENARSIGTIVTFGNFRILDMGDLTWNKERELMCPNNKIGAIDLYIVSHHGSDLPDRRRLSRAYIRALPSWITARARADRLPHGRQFTTRRASSTCGNYITPLPAAKTTTRPTPSSPIPTRSAIRPTGSRPPCIPTEL